jgi:hypothetical protein
VPTEPADRLGWEQRASSIGAYRELYGYQHPAEPIGPEPAGDSPDKRAAWHEAFAALGTAGDAQVRGMTDGMLLHLRQAYPAETAWAPPWVGDELRQVRQGGEHARLAAIRAQAEATVARHSGRDDAAARHESLRDGYQAMTAFYAERENLYAGVMDDRRAWEQATADSRRLAVAADAELRRRHPDQRFPPLKSAEPEPATAEQIETLSLEPGDHIPGPDPRAGQLAASRVAFASQLALRADQVRSEPELTSWQRSGGEPLLQPPNAEIPPSPRVLERVGERQAGLEAGN